MKYKKAKEIIIKSGEMRKNNFPVHTNTFITFSTGWVDLYLRNILHIFHKKIVIALTQLKVLPHYTEK